MARTEMVEEKTLAPAEPTLAQIMARLVALQEEQLKVQEANQRVQAEQLKQTKVKSNKLGPHVSPFNPRGEKDHPMPELKCEFWAPHKMTSAEIGGLTREEVELINLLEPCEAFIWMVDQERQPVLVVGERNVVTGKPERLSLMGPVDGKGQPTSLFTKERKNRFPGMATYLRQIINGITEDGTIKPGPADAVMTMAEEKRRVRLPPTDPEFLSCSVGE